VTTSSESQVLVVVPALNESKSIGGVVTRIRALGLQVVVVDDGSCDGTPQVARGAGARVLSLPINLGVGGALRCGFRFAIENGYNIVVQCDADGQHPPEHINSLVNVLSDSHVSLVIGSRFRSSDNQLLPSATRRIPMRLMAAVASRVTMTEITDATSGFRAIRRPLLDELASNLPAHYLGDTFEALCSVGRYGYGVAEVGVPMAERQHGVSSASSVIAIGMIIKSMFGAFFGTHARISQGQ
jgi:glycosyltransferase involved in cell wall biosynthesis